MDSVEMAETMASTVPSDFSCPHEVKAVAARRRRTEIRRFKLIAGCGEFLESANKRLKSNAGAPVKMASVDVRSSVESAKPACCSCLTEQPSITCEACQQRGDSIVVVSDAVPSKSERVISVPELLRSGGGASGNALPDRHDGGILKESRENLSRACNSAGASGLLSHATSGSEGRMQGAIPEQASRTDIDRRERNEDSDVFPQSRNLVTTCKQDRKVWRKLCAELKCPPHGVVSVIGRRREMEDAAVAVPAFFSLSETVVNGCSGSGMMSCGTLMPLHFFGVYDGHGGSQAALLCKDRLHQALAEEMTALCSAQTSQLGNSVGWRSMWEKAMAASFLRMDREVGGACPRGTQCRKEEGSDYSCCAEAVVPETVGSTAVAAVVGAGQIVVANCGDSRAVLSRGGRALPLSQDHKPEREDEMSRIEAAGGRVIRWNGFRVLGVLAMSRAIGDRFLKPYIIAEPDVTLVERSEEDECLILASDGLWDVLSNEVVCEVTRRFLAARKRGKRGTGAAASSEVEEEEKDEEEDSPAEAAAALLTKLALARGSRDNISVVVVDLQKQPSQKPPSTPILT